MRRSIVKNKLGVIYQKEGNLDSAYTFHKDALTLALKENNTNQEIAISYNKIGIIHYYHGRHDSATYFFLKSIPYYKDVLLKANSLNNLALMYKYQEKPDLAIESYLTALGIYRVEKLPNKQIVLLNNIGALHHGLKEDSLAEVYGMQALDLALKVDNEEEAVNSRANLANIYLNRKEYKKAINGYRLAIAYFTKHKSINALITNKNNLANCYDELQDYEQALHLSLGLLCLGIVGLVIIYNRYQHKKELSETLPNKLEGKDKEIELLNIEKEKGKLPYPKLYDPLTEREKEVLQGVQEGLKDKEIAAKLFISITTVRTHLRKAYSKIGLRNRAEATTFVNKHEL